MTEQSKHKEQLDEIKKNLPLTRIQKLLFGMLCWGVQSWGQAKSFKTNGFDQKYKDAKKAMYTGLTFYGISITLFILILLYLKK